MVISWVVLIYIVAIVVAIVFMHLMAILTMDIQGNKGYKPKYWIGFIFGPLAWLYYIAMPDLKMQKAIKEIGDKLNSQE